jgi:hypothetical protein
MLAPEVQKSIHIMTILWNDGWFLILQIELKIKSLL